MDALAFRQLHKYRPASAGLAIIVHCLRVVGVNSAVLATLVTLLTPIDTFGIFVT